MTVGWLLTSTFIRSGPVTTPYKSWLLKKVRMRMTPQNPYRMNIPLSWIVSWIGAKWAEFQPKTPKGQLSKQNQHTSLLFTRDCFSICYPLPPSGIKRSLTCNYVPKFFPYTFILQASLFVALSATKIFICSSMPRTLPLPIAYLLS